MVDPMALMSVFCFCTSERVLQGFCMSSPYTDLTFKNRVSYI